MTDLTTDAPPARRSRFLAGVTVFVSAWLIAFAIDGTLSTVDDLLGGLAHVSALTPLRNAFAIYAVLLFLPLVVLALVFVPQIPKRIFALPITYILWASVNPWPFAPVYTDRSTLLPLDLLQLAIAALALWRVHRRGGGFRLRAADLPVRTHLVRHTFIALGVVALALAVALPVAVAAIFAATIEKQTGGYLAFTSKGVEARETVLAKGDKKVRLVGMVHIGEERFYRDLFQSFPPDALVLVEGVSDRKELLKGKFSYGRIAAALGLEEQSGIQAEWMHAAGAASAPSAPGASASAAKPPASPGHPTILRADIDISEFTPGTIRFLGEIGELYSSPSIWEAFRRISEMDDRYADNDIEAVFKDLIDKRNARLLAVFDKESPAHPVTIIPWGAQHMPGIEKALRERGYTVQSRQALNVVRYGEMF